MSPEECIYIIDDDADVRSALQALVTSKGRSAKTYGSARSFLSDGGPKKGCLVTDVRMPDMSGVELLSQMRSDGLFLPIIVMTAYADVPLAVEIMRQGATDLLEKPFKDEKFLQAVDSALASANARRKREEEIQAIRLRKATLTSRELDVLEGLLHGRANKIIAHNLGIGIRTVETHRATVMEKMHADSLSELVRMCLIAEPERD